MKITLLMKFVLNIIIAVFLLSTIQCAKRASPTGGPKDSIPPVLINASPKLNTTYFNKDEFNLNFDEYVELKDITKQLIISPPLNSSQYKVYPVTGASKKVTLKLLDSLLDNTTYTFNFGESIVDFNESNPSSYLTYTLSTGATIDSLYIRGRITDAFERETERFISLQLYPVDSIIADTMIYSQKPLYVTSTLDTTIYRFQNLRAGKYAIIALEDKAGNYFFDQNMDKIGFNEKLIEFPSASDALIVPIVVPPSLGERQKGVLPLLRHPDVDITGLLSFKLVTLMVTACVVLLVPSLAVTVME